VNSQGSIKGMLLNKPRILTLLALLSGVSPTIVVWGAKDFGTPTQNIHEIQITLRKYEFTPASLHVKKGERVMLTMAAVDHDHGFKLDEFDINEKVRKGATASVEFTASKSGIFQFRCSTVCGIGHRGMKGTLVVEE
jgi:cytochrome c oxidase subunit 2